MDERFWINYNGCLRKRLLSRLLSRGVLLDDAEDALQEALIRLLCREHTLSNDCIYSMFEPRLLAWLTTTANRFLLDQNRHWHVALQNTYAEEFDANTATGPDMSETVHRSLMMAYAWRALSEADRRLLQLKADGNTCCDIAQLLRSRNSARISIPTRDRCLPYREGQVNETKYRSSSCSRTSHIGSQFRHIWKVVEFSGPVAQSGRDETNPWWNIVYDM